MSVIIRLSRPMCLDASLIVVKIEGYTFIVGMLSYLKELQLFT